jgi:hypothetical protein
MTLSLLGGICRAADTSQCSMYAPPVLVKGKKFFDSVSGQYVPIKGIAYYPRPNTGELTQTNSIDFFTEEYRHIWERDIAYFKSLNVNVVRIYAVDPSKNHDAFLCALQKENMYLIVELGADCYGCAVKKYPAPTCYPPSLKHRGQLIINSFARYDNILAFSAGNEASLTATNSTVNAACQKRFLRDMRAFIDRCSNTIRKIPIGLAIADIDRKENSIYYRYVCDWRQSNHENCFLIETHVSFISIPPLSIISCRTNPEDEFENADFLGINTYVDCDGAATSSENLVGFEALLADFSSYEITVPVVLTEFGCINPSYPAQGNYEDQRTFLSVDALFSDRYREEFVGGAVFEYNTELINSQSSYPFSEYSPGNWGIGYFTPENCNDIDIPCSYVPFPQFETLASKYAAVDTSSEPTMDACTVTTTALPACPESFPLIDDFDWTDVDAEPDLECANPVYIVCDGIPSECAHLGIAMLPPTPLPTSAPVVTSAPSPRPTNPPLSPTPVPTRIAPTKSTTRQPTTTTPGTNPTVGLTTDPPQGISNTSSSRLPFAWTSLLGFSFGVSFLFC